MFAIATGMIPDAHLPNFYPRLPHIVLIIVVKREYQISSDDGVSPSVVE